MRELYQISKCADRERLFNELQLPQLEMIDYVLDSYFQGKIDFNDPYTINGDPDWEGEYELIINDSNYVQIGIELLVMKWVADRESTDYLIECLKE